MTLNDKLKELKAKAEGLGLQADFWNPIVLVITPKEETPEEQALMAKLDEPSQPPLTPAPAS